MSSKDVVCLDSETSVDYYVTTVNSAETKKTDLSENKNEVVDAPNSPTIVVSVDRAGSVKVRKRKKSKRRKKKSNLALDDLTLNHSEEDTRITSSSDTTQTHHKVPKRSISLNERDLARNSKVDFTKEPISSLLNQSVLNGTTLNHSEPATPQAVAVRRRPRKKSSFRNNRKGFIENNSALGASENLVTAGGVINKKNFNVISHTDCAINTEPEDSKILKQKDALATLSMFMQEVEQATTVAKRQHEDRRKDPMLRRSRSMSHILADHDMAATDSSDGFRLKSEPPMTYVPHRSHQKQLSLDQKSVSGSVFTSDHDVTMEDGREHPILTPQSSSSGTKEKRSRSLFDLVMATDTDVLTELLYKKMSDNNQGKVPVAQMAVRHDSDYGIVHLEQMCKMMEQIGDLRKQNAELKKTIANLEHQITNLKSKEETPIDPRLSYPPPVYHKRTGRVDRIKDAISRSRRASMEKGQFEHAAINHHQPVTTNQMRSTEPQDPSGAPFGLSLPSSSFTQGPEGQPVIYSGINLRKNRRRQYARDDLELTKNRWKFWKAQSRLPPDNSNSKKHIVTAIKAEHMQGSAFHLKSASVTLDSLLKNIDNDFSQKMITWEASAKGGSRAPSRASESSAEPFNRNMQSSSSAVCLPSSDESVRYRHNRHPSDLGLDRSKESFKKKFSRWERKLTSRKISWHGDYRRSKSVERMNDPNDTDASSRPFRLRSASTTMFHQSMPCVNLPDFQNEDELKENEEPLTSTEWSALQEAFPTNSTPIVKTSASIDPLRRLISASQSRLTAPLRKKNGKRRSWSFAKRTSSHYYLPTSGEFMAQSNIEAGSLANQLTLELDQEDVRAVTHAGDSTNVEEIDYLNKNTKELRDKLSVIEKEWPTPTTDAKKVSQRPASSMARLNEDSSDSEAAGHKRSKCPFFPPIKTRRHPAPVFV